MTRFLILFSVGAFGYSFLEILWRGYTHWTMFFLGGICFFTLYHVFGYLQHTPLLINAIIGGAIITSAEFITGCIINLGFKWNVWSYSSSPYNLLGQICLPYSILWILLSIPLFYLCKLLHQYI